MSFTNLSVNVKFFMYEFVIVICKASNAYSVI